MLYARISAERIGVLIGPEGTTKERLQKATGTRISVDSTTGDVTIDEAEAQDPVLALKAKDIIQAMARGFSEDRPSAYSTRTHISRSLISRTSPTRGTASRRSGRASSGPGGRR